MHNIILIDAKPERN